MYYYQHFLVLFLAALVVSCAPPPPLNSPETGYCITGFVGVSVSEPAVSQTVMLFDNEAGKPIRSMGTNLTGNYQFCGLAPGHYLIRASGVTQGIVIRNRNKRLDIILDDCHICPKRKP